MSAEGLILASRSASRRAMLDAAGVAYEAIAADLDEAAITAEMLAKAAKPHQIGKALAEAKALAISAVHPGRWVVGSDSLISVEGRLFDKPGSREAAADHLRAFSGKTLLLDSSVALARDGEITEWASDHAHLMVRHLGEDFIQTYLDAEWPAIAACVGCFRIEGRGVQLFDTIIGSHFTILGMPLLPLLAMLRSHGAIPA